MLFNNKNKIYLESCIYVFKSAKIFITVTILLLQFVSQYFNHVHMLCRHACNHVQYVTPRIKRKQRDITTIGSQHIIIKKSI